MFRTIKERLSRSTALKASAAAGLAVAVLATGVPFEISRSYADAVTVQAPQVPSFANVVDAVSPAVVSVRVESRVNPVADDDESFGLGRGFDELPDDHPLKKFFRQFGQDQNGHGPQDHQKATPDGKGRLRPVAQGSGFFISEDGYLVTNNHVVPTAPHSSSSSPMARNSVPS
jgi:serine protease Do